MASTATRSCTLIARHATRTTQKLLLSSGVVFLEKALAHVGVPPSPRNEIACGNAGSPCYGSYKYIVWEKFSELKATPKVTPSLHSSKV